MWELVGILQPQIPIHFSSVCVPPGIRKYNFGDAAPLVWKKGNQLYRGA